MRSFKGTKWVTCALAPAALACVGCGDPSLNTDLDAEGEPEVTMVTILSETLGESATFCLNGTGVKVHKDYCPELVDENNRVIDGMRDVAAVLDAQPVGWYARVVFSELLDPEIEELIIEDTDGDGIPDAPVGHINATLPIVLTCAGKDVPYDGFYDPSGNDVTFPPGPALVVIPQQFVATGTINCQIGVRDMVTDKDGISVLPELRGPFVFGIATMAVLGSDPADLSEGVDPTSTATILFNAPVSAASLSGLVRLTDAAGEVPASIQVSAEDSTLIEIIPTAGTLAENTEYTLEVDSGLLDIAGGMLVLDETERFTFTTGTTPDEGM